MEIRIKETLERYARVLMIARKPDKEEFSISSKVCGVGIAVIGFLGFVIFIVFHLV